MDCADSPGRMIMVLIILSCITMAGAVQAADLTNLPDTSVPVNTSLSQPDPGTMSGTTTLPALLPPATGTDGPGEPSRTAHGPGAPAPAGTTGSIPGPAPGADNSRGIFPGNSSRENPRVTAGSAGKAPENRAFLAYQNRTKQSMGKKSPGQESATIILNDGSTSRVSLEGEIPAPLDFSYTRGRQISPVAGYLTEGSAYPLSYDLRESGKVSPVRDQGMAGSCWAFATIASLESSLLPGEVWDFSENHMKNTLAGTYADGFDRGWNDGGNRWISTAYLTRWSGPVPEADDPYSDLSGTSPAGLYPSKHVQDVYFLPVRSGPLDNDNIRDALMNTGAVQASLYWNGRYYRAATTAFWNDGSQIGLDPYQDDSESTNHAVTIVGWDDSYNRTNFATPPPGNGAFIVKNSWGTGWGSNGYFYVSYYDLTIGDRCTLVTGEPVTTYDRIYSYDPLGWVGSLGYGTPSALFANVFTARGAETLNAIGMYETSPGTFTAEIYLDPAGGPVNGGGPVAGTSWSDTLPGYHTIDIPDVALKPGQNYSVVVSASVPGYDYPVPVEYPAAYYSSHATANAGESYISPDGAAWTDLTTELADTNVCLKGYTTIRSKIGVFRPSTHLYYQDYTGNGAWDTRFIDRAYDFGIPGDIPVAGDWNGDGTAEIGVFRPSTHLFYEDYNGNGVWNGAVTDRSFDFGITGDIPITGDWNGDGRTEVGVFRPATLLFYEDYNGNGVWNGPLTDRSYNFGITGDIPVTGDWNGDGMTEIGVFRPSTLRFFLDYNGKGIWKGAVINRSFTFGITGDLPVTGDWNGDGTTEIGVFRPSTHLFYEDYNGNGVWNGPFTDRSYNFGITGDLPITGAWG